MLGWRLGDTLFDDAREQSLSGAVVGDKLRQLKAVDQILYLRTQKLINDLIYEAELEAAERHIY